MCRWQGLVDGVGDIQQAEVAVGRILMPKNPRTMSSIEWKPKAFERELAHCSRPSVCGCAWSFIMIYHFCCLSVPITSFQEHQPGPVPAVVVLRASRLP